MKTKTLVAAALLLSSATALAAGLRSVQTKLTVALDGKPVGSVIKAEGGYQKASAVSEKGGPGGNVRKHATKPTIEPLTLSVDGTAERGLFDWVAASWTGGRPQSKTLELTACDLSQNAVSQTTFGNALPLELTVPALDAASKDVGPFLVKVAPGSLSTQQHSGKCAQAPRQKASRITSFRLELDGVNGSGVKSIDAFTVTGTPTVQFPDLHILVDGRYAQDFVAWFNDFVVRGDASREKTGAIVFLDASLKNQVGRISLSGVGILSAAQPSSDSDDYAVDLYVEGMTLALGS